MEVIFDMLFLTFINADTWFAKKVLTWRIYSTKKTLSTIYWFKFINEEEFAKVMLDKNIKAFVIHVDSLSLGLRIKIHLARKA